jgi:hypothetical protein
VENLARRLLLPGIIASYVVLALIYNVAQPIWEAPDEDAHVEFVRYLELHHTLPLGQSTSPATNGLQGPRLDFEFSQTPLYYTALAVLLSPIQLPNVTFVHLNPFYTWPNHPWRAAIAIHRLDEGWPYHGIARFVHLGRLAAIIPGIVCLLATYAVIRSVTQKVNLALFGTAWLAWAPGFIFAGSRVDNDSAAIGGSALVLLLCARFLLRPERVGLVGAVALGLALAGALLSKLSMVYLVPLVAITIAVGWAHWPAAERTRRAAVAAVAALVVPTTALLGWWLAVGRSFGDWIDTQAGLGVVDVGAPGTGLNVGRFVDAILRWNDTWWNGVGAGFTIGPTAVYLALGASLLVLLGSGTYALARMAPRLSETTLSRPRARVTAIFLGLAAALLLYSTIARQALPWVNLDAHARFTFPAAPALALIAALGGAALPLRGWRGPVAGIYLGSLLSLAIYTPFGFIPELNIPIVPARLPVSQNELGTPAAVSFGNGIDLLAARAPDTLGGGATLPVTLEWRVVQPSASDFTASLQLIDGFGKRVTGADAIPIPQTFPPHLWHSGEIVDDQRSLVVPAELPPGTYQLQVGLYSLASDNRIVPIPIQAPASAGTRVTVATWRLLPDTAGLAAARPSGARFGDALALVGYSLQASSTQVHAQLYWRADQAIGTNLMVSVQALDSGGRLVAQSDGEPVHGAFPTATWRAGEVIADDHDVVLPLGSAALRQVILVVYDPQSLRRLPVDESGSVVGDHLILG